MVAGKPYFLRDDRILPAKHEDIKLCVTAEHIFNPVAHHGKVKTDIPDMVIVGGQGDFAVQSILHTLLQTSGIGCTLVKCLQIFAKIAFPLGAVGIRIDGCAQVVQLHLRAVADIDAILTEA